jgi:hypothetical protein
MIVHVFTDSVNTASHCAFVLPILDSLPSFSSVSASSQSHQQQSHQPHLALLPVALGGSPLVGHCALHIRLRGKPICGSPFAIPMLDPAVPPPCQVWL